MLQDTSIMNLSPDHKVVKHKICHGIRRPVMVQMSDMQEFNLLELQYIQF